ncbi:aldo/keto reductase [Aestuariimicrobium soli]|uniref:aldo/keto reductase n=1 Tax=Aestuariimicrobium soli TaxID=2035834 RepID=UPI003EBD8E35
MTFALGCAPLGNHGIELTDDQAHAVLAGAWDHGVRAFDTAPHYGLGLSERRLGRLLAGVPREQALVATKVGRLLVPQDAAGRLDDEGFLVPADHRRVPDYSADGVRRSLHESLDRLGLDRVDISYVHDAERYNLEAGLTTALEGLQLLKQEGLVDTIGFASMDAAALLRAADSGDWDELMVAGVHTLASDGTRVLDRALETDTRVAAAAIFNGGVLATGLLPDRENLFDYEPISPGKTAVVKRLEALCAAHGVALPAAALQFPLRHPAVVRVVVGGITADQVARNLHLLRSPVPEDFWRELAA